MNSDGTIAASQIGILSLNRPRIRSIMNTAAKPAATVAIAGNFYARWSRTGSHRRCRTH